MFRLLLMQSAPPILAAHPLPILFAVISPRIFRVYIASHLRRIAPPNQPSNGQAMAKS